jgi:NAD(P)-dependent dehydrogenase (short-subunit alcohol dehydrogenase family)
LKSSHSAEQGRKMDLKLAGKRAVITGGSRGIGRAIASVLAKEGVEIVIAARELETLAQTAIEIGEGTGRIVHPITFDSRCDASVASMMKAAHTALGGLDILVNAAATPSSTSAQLMLSDIDPAGLLMEFDEKLLGYLRTAQHAAPDMIERGWGRIISIGGLAARATGSYSSSIRNVAVAALTKCLADELGPKGINVSVVHPGATRTERTQRRIKENAIAMVISEQQSEKQLFGHSLTGRIVEAEEIVAIVARLASPLGAAVNGDVIAAGGGTAKAIYY